MGQLVEIDKSLYNNILQWCNAKGIEPIKYIEKALRERIATDKYGDLNEKFKMKKEKEPVIVEETKPVVEAVVEESKKPEPKTEVEESLTNESDALTKTPTNTDESGKFAQAMETIGDNETSRRKRTLKTT